MRYCGVTRLVLFISRSSGTLLIILSTQVEYLVVAVDESAKKARLSLAQAEILKNLAEEEESWKAGGSSHDENTE